MKRKNLFLRLLFALVFALPCTAQAPQPAPQPQAPPQASQQPEPEYKISKQEAEELFRDVDQILQFVSHDTGLPIKHHLERKLASRDQVEHYLEQRMKEDPDAERLDRSSVVLKKLGLLPKDFQLRPFLLKLLKEQVAGYYDAKSKTVYLLDWVDPVAQKPVLAHELTHALQDQNFGIDKWSEINNKKLDLQQDMQRDEARTARQAVLEGQAMVVLLDYMLAPLNKNVIDSPALVDAIKSEMVSSGSTPAYAAAPTFLREGLTFPYSYGLDFERQVLVARGKQGAFAGIFRDPPTNTRQVMQPKSFLEDERIPALKVADLQKVLGKDYELYDAGTLGEFDLHVIVKQWSDKQGAGEADAQKLPSAWRGGYYVAVQRKKQPDAPVQLALMLRFANHEAAVRFANFYREALAKRYTDVKTTPEGTATSEGLVQPQVDGDYFVSTESFDAESAGKVRDAMLKAAQAMD